MKNNKRRAQKKKEDVKKTGLVKKMFLNFPDDLFFCCQFCSNILPFATKIKLFPDLSLTLFFENMFVVFFQHDLSNHPPFSFRRELKMFLKNLVGKLCSVFSLLLLFLFSLFSCVTTERTQTSLAQQRHRTRQCAQESFQSPNAIFDAW